MVRDPGAGDGTPLTGHKLKGRASDVYRERRGGRKGGKVRFALGKEVEKLLVSSYTSSLDVYLR